MKGWKIYETIGIGIINPMSLQTPVQKLYKFILKHGLNVKVISQEDGEYTLEIHNFGNYKGWGKIKLKPKEDK